MLPNFRQIIIASGFALTLLAINGTIAAETATQEIINARQETQIWTTYALSPYLRANDLKVSVHNGKATLTGKVADSVDQELAKQIALGVSGISEVDNQIVVQADFTPPARSAVRSYGEVIDDISISAAVKSKLVWSTYTNGAATEVDTQWGKVTLLGVTDSVTSKDMAGRLAMSTRGVVSVNNQLLVVASKPTATDTAKSSVKEVGRGIADSWITAKVKSTFLYSTRVDGSKIAVSTSGGTVTLTGKLDSLSERNQAIDLAKNIRGVKRVRSTGLIL